MTSELSTRRGSRGSDHRGCALDRRSQRDDADRSACDGAANSRHRRGHLPSRVPWLAASSSPTLPASSLRLWVIRRRPESLRELMGADPSLGTLTEQIIDRAAGNPFFVHELIRDLAERKIIDGEAGAYVRHGDLADVAVPPTLQAAIASRIDRFTTGAKQLLNAAALIGSQFASDLLANISETRTSFDRVDAFGTRARRVDLSRCLDVVHRVRVPSPDDPHGRPGVSAEIRPLGAASAVRRRHRAPQRTRCPTRMPRSLRPTSRRQEICVTRSAGTCAPEPGSSTETSAPPGPTGSTPA